MGKFLIATGFLVAASSAAVAQGYAYYGSYSGVPYAYGPGNGLYDYVPGAYPVAPTLGGFGYGNWYDYERSDAPGRGNSAESQR